MIDTRVPPLKSDLENFPQHIFRAYDIRGVAELELTPEVVHDIGLALGSEVISHGGNSMVVARDGRLSGPLLVEALIEGITTTGCEVIDIGMVPTPVLYFATHVTGTNSGVMLTGSHNPKEYNGLKMVVSGQALTKEPIERLYWRIRMGDIQTGRGTKTQLDILPQYYQRIAEDVKLAKPLKIVVDAGNGVGAVTAPTVFKQLGCDVVELYCQVDGHFPNHHPDPGKPDNLQDLIAKVQQVGADLGLAFDGDADRVGVVTPQGKIIWPDRQLIVFAEDICRQNPGAPIVFDVKCSRYVGQAIEQAGGKPVMYRTGHSVIKSKMKQIGALFAGEMSGHMFFGDRWYGFDDGVYAAARLLEILANQALDADAFFAKVPEAVSTPEINIAVPDDRKFTLVDKLVQNANFTDATIIDIDGLRVEFSDGWALVRASNTTPCLVLRFEADDEAALVRIQGEFKTYILSQAPDLELLF